MYIRISEHLTRGHHRERNTEAIQFPAGEITVQALQVRSVLIITPRQRIPYHVGDSLDESSSGVLGGFGSSLAAQSAANDADEFVVQCMHIFIRDLRKAYRHQLVSVDVFGLLDLGGARFRQAVFYGSDDDGQKREVRFAAELLFEQFDQPADAVDGETRALGPSGPHFAIRSSLQRTLSGVCRL